MKTLKGIKWCFRNKNGISLIEPSANLAEGHIKIAEEALHEMQKSDSRRWKTIEAYYTVYESVYAIFVRIGIKCEIHDCTIGFLQLFLNKYFTKEEGEFMEKAFQARKDVQYYANREVKDDFYQSMLDNAPKFIAKAKKIISTITEKDVKEIREKVESQGKK